MKVNPTTLQEIDGKEIHYQRILNAPRELVFKAWTEPERLAKWFGPNGFTITTHSSDMRTGGHWTFTMHGPDGHDFPNKVNFLKVEPPELLEYKHAGDGETEDVDFQVTVTFDEADDDKCLLNMRMLFSSREVLERVERDYQAIQGGVENMARLEAYVNSL